jgi:hypothetical protein
MKCLIDGLAQVVRLASGYFSVVLQAASAPMLSEAVDIPVLLRCLEKTDGSHDIVRQLCKLLVNTAPVMVEVEACVKAFTPLQHTSHVRPHEADVFRVIQALGSRQVRGHGCVVVGILIVGCRT